MITNTTAIIICNNNIVDLLIGILPTVGEE